MRRTICVLMCLMLYRCKDYVNAGEDWTESTCSPTNNPSVSPVILKRDETVCNSTLFMDMYIFNLGSQTISISYKGDPKTIRIGTDSSFCRLFLRNGGGRIITYSLQEVVFRYPPEHTIVNDSVDVEGQFFFLIDDETMDLTAEKNIIMSIFYIKQDIVSTSGFFFSILAALKNIDVDKIFKTATVPITTTVTSLGGLNSVFPRPFKFLSYKGTETDNACSESRLWIIVEQPVPLSKSLIEYYESYLKNITGADGNARRVTNPNKVVVSNCGIRCDEFFEAFLWCFLLYSSVLYLIYKFV